MTSRSFVFAFALFAAISACREDAPVPAPETPSIAVPSVPEVVGDPGCTLETPLVPGVPGSPGHLIKTATNPNGQSELAILMRGMQDHMKAVREAIEAGSTLPPYPPGHARMRCAWPTTPSDRDAAYEGFSINYLAQLEALHDATSTVPVRERFNHVVTACRSCHENSCPGPIVAIDKLRLP
jgi:hypothetical protein